MIHPEEHKEMMSYIKKWHKKLGIHNWTVIGRFMTVQEMSEKNLSGRCEICHTMETAEIAVIRREHHTHSFLDYDMEEIVLHEMLHIVFEISPKNEEQKNIFETALNRIVRTMLSMDRASNPPKDNANNVILPITTIEDEAHGIPETP